LNPTEECELDPHNLENIEAAADKLLYHLRRKSKILFVVDCDADGFTSSSILWLYIKHIFPEADLEFTVHEHKQHGLNDKIDWITDMCLWDLVICPDAGSYDVKEHRLLGEMGMDVICLDHHEQLYDDQGNPVTSNLPTTIVVNNQLSPDYPNKSLCGAGVV
jgi:single-stranded-DNA-specific exonuclease